MRRRATVVAIVGVLLAVAVAAGIALRRPPARLPFNPLAGAEEGEWAAYSVTLRRSDGTVFVETVAATTIGETVGEAVELLCDEWYQKEPERAWRKLSTTRQVSRTDPAPTIASYFGSSKESFFHSVSVAEARVSVGGRAFPCTRIEYAGSDYAWEERLHFHASFSRDVGGWGVVTADLVGHHELVGFGTKAGTAWGRTATELMAEIASRVPR